MKKSELRQMIREVLHEELKKTKLIESSGNKLVYVLATRDGNNIIYSDFDIAVDDAEGILSDSAKTVTAKYLGATGAFKEVPEKDSGYHRWTEEEGILA